MGRVHALYTRGPVKSVAREGGLRGTELCGVTKDKQNTLVDLYKLILVVYD